MKADQQTSPAQAAEALQRLSYAPPTVQINALRLITLGGSVGGGDSGAAGSEEPGGGVWRDDNEIQPRDDDEWVG